MPFTKDEDTRRIEGTQGAYGTKGTLSPGMTYIPMPLNISKPAPIKPGGSTMLKSPGQSQANIPGWNQSITDSATGVGLSQKAQMDEQNRIPLPSAQGIRPLNQTLDTPMGTGMNLMPEDYQNIAGKSALDILSMYMPRAEIDSRFPMGVTEEDAMAYLWDNYSWLFPEQTGSMGGGGGTGGGSGYGLSNDIPLPDMSWGGGGYGNSQDYLRDSGLINWRI